MANINSDIDNKIDGAPKDKINWELREETFTIIQKIISLSSRSNKLSLTDKLPNQYVNLKNNIYMNLKWRDNYCVLEPDYKYLIGGKSHDIYPLVTDVYNKNGLSGLSFISKDRLIKIDIDPFANPFDIIRGPMLAAGSFTAVYKTKYNGSDYILRLTSETYNKIHFLYENKVENNYNIYSNHMMQIFLHGKINFKDPSPAILYNPRDRGPITKFTFDYILTRAYNNSEKVSLLTNANKYKLVENLLILLDKMFKNNEFHTDLKLDNIGWNENYDIILIDYDEKTIMSLDEIKQPPYKVKISTYWPRYTIPGEGTLSVLNYDNYKKFLFFSMSGLYSTIQDLLLSVREKGSLVVINHLDRIESFSEDRLHPRSYDTFFNSSKKITYDYAYLLDRLHEYEPV
jgi:hypothetical protein